MEQFVTPDTGAYLILGLVVVGITLVGYVGSLWLRLRSSLSDEKTIEELR
jgi:hypothetical protein